MMKKLNYIILSIILLFSFNKSVSALSAYLSLSNNNVYVGDTFKVSVNIRGAASWLVKVDSTGPVSGCSINESDVTRTALNANKSYTTTCKATGTGTITIRLSGDITAEDDAWTEISDTKTVYVTKPNIDSNTNNNQKKTPTTEEKNVGKSNNNK